MAWYVYMLRCGDGSLYTGSTTDVAVGSGSTRTGPGPNTLAPGLRCRWPTQRRLRTAPPPSAGRRLSKSCPGNGNWR